MSRRVYLLLLIVLATIAALHRVVNHRFTSWDDVSTIAYNTRLNPPTAAGLGQMWKKPQMGLYVPVTYTAWAGIAVAAHRASDDKGIQLNPAYFHAANLAAHVMAGMVVFALLRLLVRNDLAAAIGAMLFALHPVQVETVAWTSGLKDLLCGLFTLIALWQYVMYVRENRAASYRLATLALVLAMLSKPTAMVAPVMALVIHVVLLRRSIREAVRPLSLWFVLALVCALIARAIQPGTGVETGSIITRPVIAGDALTFYLGQIVWPAQLGIDYGRTPMSVLGSGWSYLLCLVPITAMGVAVLRMKSPKHRRLLLAATALFVIPLLPVLGSVPFMFQAISTVADHYLYFAMLGPALLLAYGVRHWPTAPMRLACAAILIACGVRSFIQTGAWENDFTLYRQAIATNPKSAVGYNNLGQAYQMNHDLPKAEACYFRAIEVQPLFQPARQNLGACLAYQGKMEAAIVQLREVQRLEKLKPAALRHDLSDCFYGLGEIVEAGHRDDDAARLYAEALRQKPGDPRVLWKLRDRARGDTSVSPVLFNP
jgi:hypothetical protein